MGSAVQCRLCGKNLIFKPSQVSVLGEHLLEKHQNCSVAHFSFENGGKSDKNIKQGWGNWKKKKKRNMYKTTVETWRPGTSLLECSSCGRSGEPLIRKQRNKVAQSSLGALCLLGCWPLCFLPFILGGSNVMNLYCKYCGEFLGTYDRKTGRLQPPDENAASVRAPNVCNCTD